MDDLSTEFLLAHAFDNLVLDSKDKIPVTENGIDTGWYSFDANILQNKVTEMYENNIENQSFKIEYGAECIYNNGKYRYSVGGGSGETIENVRKIEEAYEEDNNIYIIDKYMALIYKDEQPIKIYTNSECKEIIDKIDNIPNIEDFKNDAIKKYKLKTYKHTFKKNSNGKFYWYSTEPIK